MVRLYKKLSKSAGMKPGALVHIGEKRIDKVKVGLIDYNETDFRRTELDSIDEILSLKDTPEVSWIDITGLHDISVIEKIGNHFGVHPLLQEDVLNTGLRPKFELSEKIGFFSMKMIYFDKEDQLLSEQISVVFGDKFVITFQEKEGDVFDKVRERIQKTVPRIRFMNSDYLAYSLIDAVVDSYYLVLEHVGEDIESLEDKIVSAFQPELLETVHDLKRELIYLRKAIWPLREAVGGFERDESDLLHDSTKPYLRDLYEHVVQIIDTVETFRDMVSSQLDIYLTGVSNRMNEVMKILTIIATIFIPLGFLAGVYGMNFDTSASPFNMPELGLKYGYILFWGLALLIGVGLFAFFKRKKWL